VSDPLADDLELVLAGEPLGFFGVLLVGRRPENAPPKPAAREASDTNRRRCRDFERRERRDSNPRPPA
jgi:hypothetical protein